ncbi:MAG: hypothetical protein ACRDHX_01155 [Chloroflexota bacterium]
MATLALTEATGKRPLSVEYLDFSAQRFDDWLTRRTQGDLLIEAFPTFVPAANVPPLQQSGSGPERVDASRFLLGTIGGAAAATAALGGPIVLAAAGGAILGAALAGLVAAVFEAAGTNSLANALSGHQPRVLPIQQAGPVSHETNADPHVIVTPGKPSLANELRTLTGLPVKELAALMQVTDRRFFDWLNGQSMSIEKERRILRLKALAEAIASTRSNVREWLLTPVAADSKTRLDLIAASDDDNSLRSLIQILDLNALATLASNLERAYSELVPNPIQASAEDRQWVRQALLRKATPRQSRTRNQ